MSESSRGTLFLRRCRWLPALLLLLLLAPLIPPPAQAQGALPPGTWEGYMDRSVTISQELYGITISGSGGTHADLHLVVAADGSISGSITNAKGRADWQTSGLGQEVTGYCEVHWQATITGGSAVENPAHLPAITLQLQAELLSSQCNPPAGGQGQAPTELTLEPTAFTGSKVSGTTARFDVDMVEQILNSVAQAGFSTNLTEHWELKSTSGNVEAIIPGYEVYFLEGIPFNNTYSAVVNWNDQPPGKVVFTLGGLTQDVPAEDSEVNVTWDLSMIPAGQQTLEATAVTASGATGTPFDYQVVIVPRDPWVKKAGFHVTKTGQQGTANVVFYGGKSTLPEQPIQLPYIDLSAIPLVGGQWGIPPFQINVDLEATSGGGVSQETPITGQMDLYLGGKDPNVAMKVSGTAATEMTAGELKLDHGQANFQVDPPVHLDHSIGVVSLIPGLAALYPVPGLGDLIKALNGIAGIKGKVTVTGDGQADIGVAPDKSALVFTNGHVTPAVQVLVGTFVGYQGVAWLWVGGGGQGSFTINIAPTTGLANCQGALLFQAQAGVWFAPPAAYEAKYDLGKCVQALAGRTAGLGRPLPLQSIPLAAQSRPIALPMGEEATVLVSGAAPQAAPALALGPQGLLAYTWTARDGSGPSSHIAFRLYDGQKWGEVLQVSPGEGADWNPSAAFDSQGNLVLAWMRASAGSLAKDALPGEEFYRGLEIAYAVVDPASGQVTAQDAVTADQAMDFGPQLVRAADGTVWLSWQKSPGLSLTGRADAPNALLAARWDGKRWSKPETVTDQLAGTLGVHLAAWDRQTALAVADLDMDGSLDTATDREVVAWERSSSGWGPLHRLTQDSEPDSWPLAAYSAEGRPVVAWQKGDRLYGVEGQLDVAPQEWSVGSTAAPDTANGSLLAGAKGELALLWTDYSPAGQAVWLAHRPGDGQPWEEPRMLDEESAGLAALSAVAAPGGDLWMGFGRLPQSVDPLGLSAPTPPTTADLLVLHTPPLLQPFTPAVKPAATGGLAAVWPWAAAAGGVLLLGGLAVGLLFRRRR